jgi:hypothetical protein
MERIIRREDEGQLTPLFPKVMLLARDLKPFNFVSVKMLQRCISPKMCILIGRTNHSSVVSASGCKAPPNRAPIVEDSEPE